MDKEMKGKVALLLTPIIFQVISIIIFLASIGLQRELNEKVYIFSIGIQLALHLFFTYILGSSQRSLVLQIIIQIILLILNKLRFIYTYEPITFSDFAYASNVGELFTLVKKDIISQILQILPQFLIFILVYVVFAVIHKKFNYIVKEDYKKRILKAMVPAVVIVIIFLPIPSLNNFILAKVYNREKEADYSHNTTNIDYYLEEGLIGGMYANYLENRIMKPNNYNKNELKKILAETEYTQESKYGKPNIIVMFSESFFDVDLLKDDITFTKKVTSNLNRLKEKGILVNTISPSYGGLSANVEFELLTGFSCDYFKQGYVPFIQLIKDKKYATKNSIVKQLKNNGYTTKVVFGQDFFNSEKVYKNLGIDTYEELNIPEYYKGYYTSDEYLTDNVINVLKNRKEDEKIFMMTCTIQSHMPFYLDKYSEYDIQVEKSNLSEKLQGNVLAYAQGCYDADEQLGRLYEFLQTYEDPTILVFLGDHLPYLPDYDTDEDILQNMSYFKNNDELTNTFRKYNTQALITANFDLDEAGTTQYMSADMLLTSIINNMDIEIDDYYKWLNYTKTDLPDSNMFVTADKNGNLFWTKQLSGKMKEVLDLRERMQYLQLID